VYHCLTFIFEKYIECKQFLNLINHVKKMASMFGNKYAREQFISSMKPSKNKFKTQSNDDHLKGVIGLLPA